jgi:hypothetical protein
VVVKICVSAAAFVSALISIPSGWMQPVDRVQALADAPGFELALPASPRAAAAVFPPLAPVATAAILEFAFANVLRIRRFDTGMPITEVREPRRPTILATYVAVEKAALRIARTTGRNRFGFRTDRHNNPTAMTTELAAEAGLIDGEDYVRGDSFRGPDGKTYYTAKFLGDPVATSIRAMDQVGLYTQSGRTRWTYLKRIPAAAKWARLTYQEKAGIVFKMYRMEGGSGQLEKKPADANGAAGTSTR